MAAQATAAVALNDPVLGLGRDQGAARVDLTAYAFLALMVLIGSSTAPAAKYVVRDLPTGLVPLVRFGLSGLVLLPIVWRSSAFRGLLREGWPRLLVAAACCVPINQYFFLNGAKLAPTTHVALIYSACPLIVLLLATMLKQERMTPGRVFGVLSSVLGLGVIALGNLREAGVSGRSVLIGDGLLVFAVASWAGYLTASKPLVARYGSLPTLAGTFLVGSLLDLPVAAWSAGSWTSLATVGPTAWIALIHLTFVVTILGLLFQNLAMRRLDASQVATVGNAAPLLSMLWGHLLFGDRLTPTLALGGGLVLLSVLGTSSPARKVSAELGSPEG